MSSRLSLALAVVLAVARAADADEKPRGVALPAPTVEVFAPPAPQPRYALVYAGAALFASSYVPSAAAGIGGGEPTLAIPVVGPLIALWRLGDQHCDSDGTGFCGVDHATHHTGFVHGVLILDAAAQVTGVVLAIVGVAWKKRAPSDGSVALAPWATPTGGGLSLAGAF